MRRKPPHRPAFLHPMAITATLVAAALLLGVWFAWPGERPPIALFLAGLVVVCLIPSVAATVLGRRKKYFRTREEIERILNLPVLATCSTERER